MNDRPRLPWCLLALAAPLAANCVPGGTLLTGGTGGGTTSSSTDSGTGGGTTAGTGGGTTAATGGGTTSSSATSSTSGSGGGCSASQKLCGQQCVADDDPAYGCGASGCTACALDHATAKCAAGVCAVASCTGGYLDCNGLPGDGCEVDPTSDVQSCGACNAACTNANGTTACVNSACTPACATGFGDCDGMPQNGCEANLGSDAANCGMCAHACSPVTSAWATAPSMPTARHDLAVATVNGLLYAIGGYVNGAPISTNEAFNPMTSTWASEAPMPTPTNWGSPNAALVNGILYLVGGNAAGACTTAVEAYDPASNSWQAKAGLPAARCGVAAVTLNGLVYAVGGEDESGNQYGTMAVYNPVTDTWASAPSMITCRENAAAAVLGGKLYVVGGWAGSAGQCQTGNASGTLGVNEVFDPSTTTWTSKAAMLTARSQAGIAVLNGRLYVLGGDQTPGPPTSVVESYDPSADAWTTELPMPTARIGLAAALVGGSIYAVGGYNSNWLATVEVFSPALACVGGVCGG